MKHIKLNPWGNSYPEGAPIYKIRLLKSVHDFPIDTILFVMESQNPYFLGKWRINDSCFVSKDFCEVLEE